MQKTTLSRKRQQTCIFVHVVLFIFYLLLQCIHSTCVFVLWHRIIRVCDPWAPLQVPPLLSKLSVLRCVSSLLLSPVSLIWPLCPPIFSALSNLLLSVSLYPPPPASHPRVPQVISLMCLISKVFHPCRSSRRGITVYRKLEKQTWNVLFGCIFRHCWS